MWFSSACGGVIVRFAYAHEGDHADVTIAKAMEHGFPLIRSSRRCARTAADFLCSQLQACGWDLTVPCW
jgi:hypothetical protein